MSKYYHLLTIIICCIYWYVVSLICEIEINSINQLNYNIMYLQELINTFNNNESVNFEKICPYKNLLYTYYKEVYMCEPFLVVTDVFNAVQFVAVVPFTEVTDWISDYLNQYDMDETEKIEATETILFNSMPLERLVNLLNN